MKMKSSSEIARLISRAAKLMPTAKQAEAGLARFGKLASESAGEMNDFHTEKHNRDVELTDLLTHLLDRYGDWMTPLDRERIEELTKPAE